MTPSSPASSGHGPQTLLNIVGFEGSVQCLGKPLRWQEVIYVTCWATWPETRARAGNSALKPQWIKHKRHNREHSPSGPRAPRGDTDPDATKDSAQRGETNAHANHQSGEKRPATWAAAFGVWSPLRAPRTPRITCRPGRGGATSRLSPPVGSDGSRRARSRPVLTQPPEATGSHGGATLWQAAPAMPLPLFKSRHRSRPESPSTSTTGSSTSRGSNAGDRRQVSPAAGGGRRRRLRPTLPAPAQSCGPDSCFLKEAGAAL